MTAGSKTTGTLTNNNLPYTPTAFVGREKDIAAACDLLRGDEVRLVTLTGPGGTGKTRLAIQVASQLLGDFPDGVYFVHLAPINDPALVATSIAQTLDVMESGSKPLVDSLKAYLREKRALLILDNFEQILEAAPLVTDLLGAAPNLKVLATSRARLRLRGEQELPVPPLTLPDAKQTPTAERLTQYEAVRLFIQRAKAVRPDFEVDGENAPAIAEICARLDGLPLAIELAAPRIKILTPDAMLDRLENRLRLLTGGSRDLPARHQTLRGAIEWSYDLLTDEERTLFRRVSIFAGSRSLEAVEAICATGGGIYDILDTMSSLVDQNLMQQLAQARHETRFTMLETLQEYAREKLHESGETEALGDAHAHYFLEMAEQAEPELRGAGQGEWLDRLEIDHDNLRAALRWSLSHGDGETALRLGGALVQFWKMHGHITEGRNWLDEALRILDFGPSVSESPQGEQTLPDEEVQNTKYKILGLPATDRENPKSKIQNPKSKIQSAYLAKAAMAAGTLAWTQGDYERADMLLERSLQLFRQLGDKASIVATLRNLGNEARHIGNFEMAYSRLLEGLGIARELGDRLEIAVVLGDLGIVAQALGDEEAARRYYEESLSIRRELSDRRGVAMMLVNLGELARANGQYDEAYDLYTEGLAIARELGDRWGVGMVLHNLGHVAYHRGDYDEAYDLFTESLRIFYELRNKRDIAYCLAALAGLFGAQRQPERAAMLFSAAQTLFNTISSHLDPADTIEFERNLAATKAQMSEAEWERAWARGQIMTLGEAVVAALEKTPWTEQADGSGLPAGTTRPARATGPLNPPVTGPLGEDFPGGLSEREVEVLRLVAQGKTDNQVAEKLVISPRTVHRHLSSIYAKLEVTTRTAAAMRAAELGLV